MSVDKNPDGGGLIKMTWEEHAVLGCVRPGEVMHRAMR